MKTKKNSRRVFFNVRALVSFVLCFVAGMLALVAFGAPNDKKQTSGSSHWLTRLASSIGIDSPAQRFAGGGGIKTDKEPGDRTQALLPAAGPYNGPPRDLRPVAAVRSEKLRDIAPIDPASVAKFPHPEPIRPKPPTKSGGPAGPIQTEAGSQTSAPTPTGLRFDGVGVGLGGFSPSSNPPDVNGRVGSTQYVQWNNTSFAVFNKTTGALEYGPAAGNTLFQALGGVCASHNDGDPVVSYDILAGRWILSQFVVAAGQTNYSHQCIAVSTTSDATGEYYLYDFQTDPVNFVDYPHTGVWPDGYYMSSHVFGAGLVFTTGRIYVFERQKMIAGLPARMQSSDLGAEFGFLPADLDSLTPPPAGAAEFLLGPNFALTNLTNSHRVAVTWDPAPTMVVTSGPPIMGGVGNAPCLSGVTDEGRDCVPQPAPAAPTDYLDNLGGHYMYRLAYRNNGTQESLVVSGPSSGSDANHGAVEWFEFRNAGSSATQPTLFQSGTFDPDTSYRWMPSAAMDKDGNIALGYSKSSPTTVKPGIYVTGRLATDPVGTMGAETELQAGLGVQLGAGNRWGDYSAMTLDPIDQCTFYYTNEYLRANGGFNWSTKIASYKFPSCASAAGLWGTVTGTITSPKTSAPIPGVTVSLSNGYAGAANQNGIYTIIVPAGTYTATAADPNRNCTTASPASAMVSPPGGGMVTQNFTVTGTSKLEANGFTIDDSLGNNNQIVNRAECVKLNLGVKNNGCATESAISATLTTTTTGVTVVNGNSTYPDMPIDASGTNATPFKISVSDSFVCGTEIVLSLNLAYASGMKTIQFTLPSCAGGPDQAIPPSQLMTSDMTQADRIGRDGRPSPCGGKASPGGGFAGTHWYKTYTFMNTSGAARCYTVTINADLNGPGDIESVAYDQVYDPTNLATNYLGDTGISGLGTTVGQASYSFTVPAGHNFVIVVNTTGSTTSGTIASSPYSGTVSGFIDNTAGPGDCSTTTSPTPTPTPTATPTPGGTPTPTQTPQPSPTPTPSATPTPSPTPTPAFVSISGAVNYCTGSPRQVPNVTLNLSGDTTDSTDTDGSGNYTLSSIPTGGNYTVTPSEADILQSASSTGIDTLDASAVQRHYLGLGTPLAGCALAASRVNPDNGGPGPDTTDASAIQRFYLGLPNGTGNAGQWRFNPNNRLYQPLSGNQAAQNYDTYVLGDVTGDLVFPGAAPVPMEVSAPAGVASVILPTMTVPSSAGNFSAVVSASNIDAGEKLIAFQGDFTFDSSVITFQNPPVAKAGITAQGNWALAANVLGTGKIKTLRVSCFALDATSVLAAEGTLFELRLKVANGVKAEASTPLVWSAGPNNFIFFDANLQRRAPASTPQGKIGWSRSIRQR